MNTGIYGEGFPYSNFHDLNMDWIIKIAKDFLDQYTHIQEIIEQGKTDIQELTTSGLEQLQEKADNLEELLQAWYDEHSTDIADQLADALSDLNSWYNEHQTYLDQYLNTMVATFTTQANNKANEVLESIPEDYTNLSNEVTALFNLISPYISESIKKMANAENIPVYLPYTLFSGERRNTTMSDPPATSSNTLCTNFFTFDADTQITPSDGYKILIARFNADGTYLGSSGGYTTETLDLTYQQCAYYSIEIRKNDNSNFTIGEFDYGMTIKLVRSNEIGNAILRTAYDTPVYINDLAEKIVNGKTIANLLSYNVVNGERRNTAMTDSPTASTNTVCTPVFENNNEPIYIKPSNGYKAIIVRYNDDGSYQAYYPGTGFTTDEIFWDNEVKYFAVEIRKTDNSDFSADDFNRADVLIGYGKITNIIELTEDIATPLVLTGNTIIEGNNHSINLGTQIATPSNFNNGFAEIPYSAQSSEHLYKVFVNQTEQLTSQSPYPHYNVGIYAVGSVDSECVQLTPYLSIADVRNNDNSFTYDGTNITLHISNLTNITSIVMANDDDSSYCIISNGHDVEIRNLNMLFSGNSNLKITNGKYKLTNCTMAFSRSNCGFETLFTNGECYNCIAHHCAGDGFNYHDGYNHIAVGCTGSYNGDDGISHHGATTRFVIDGGEYHHNGKGGIASPTYGAIGEIKNSYIHHNEYAIYALTNQTRPQEKMTLIIAGCVLAYNDYGIRTFYKTIMMNCILSHNNTDTVIGGNGNITSY